MVNIQDEIDSAIEVVKKQGLTIPNREGGARLDSRVVEDVLLDALDDAGEVNPYVLALARDIISHAQ